MFMAYALLFVLVVIYSAVIAGTLISFGKTQKMKSFLRDE